jgi:hypothetical protein
MKHLFAFAIVYLSISLLACQDTREVSRTRPVDVSMYKNIGHQISNETAERWMSTYKVKTNPSSRLDLQSYFIGSENLHAVTGSISGLIGVAFHHATDGLGNHHFIIIPVDESFTLWSDEPGKLYIDANTNTKIDRETAEAWSNNYKAQHQSDIWFHFFGSNVFSEIALIPDFNSLDIQPALNDENLTAQLLLIVSDSSLPILSGGRTAEYKAVYDASSPCPPCAVQ